MLRMAKRIRAVGSSIPEIQGLERVLRSGPTQLALVELYRRSQSEHARNGKCTMEIGSSREKDLVSVLMLDMGDTVSAEIDNNALEDVRIGSQLFSIKHITGSVGMGSIKAKWTADADQARAFVTESLVDGHTHPHILLSYLDVKVGKLTLCCVESTRCTEVIHSLGADAFKVAVGTNNRGVEYSRRAIQQFLDGCAFAIDINGIDFHGGLDPYRRRMEEIRRFREQAEHKAGDQVPE